MLLHDKNYPYNITFKNEKPLFLEFDCSVSQNHVQRNELSKWVFNYNTM